MEFEILWTPEAKQEYNNVLEQILEKWTKKEVETFIQKSNKVLSLIAKTPEMYPQEKIEMCVNVLSQNKSVCIIELKRKNWNWFLFGIIAKIPIS